MSEDWLIITLIILGGLFIISLMLNWFLWKLTKGQIQTIKKQHDKLISYTNLMEIKPKHNIKLDLESKNG